MDQIRKPTPLSVLLCLASLVIASDVCARDTEISDRSLFKWSQLPEFPVANGVAGPFVGVHNGALIVAGGANFPKGVPWRPTAGGNQSLKRYHREIYILPRHPSAEASADPDYVWITSVVDLEEPVAYGATVPTEYGLLCIGGESLPHDIDPRATEVRSTKSPSDRVFLLRWDGEQIQVDDRLGPEHHPLPPLPVGLSDMAVALIDQAIYVAGGNRASGPTNGFFRLDLNRSIAESGNVEAASWGWEELPTWPGPARSHAIGIAQHNGKTDCFYLLSGRNVLPGQRPAIFQDVYRFNPQQYRRQQQGVSSAREYRTWERLGDIRPDGATPRAIMAGSGVALGAQHIAVFGGADGRLFTTLEYDLPQQIEHARIAGDEALTQQLEMQKVELLDHHPGFSRDILLYHTITDTWVRRGQLEDAIPVTTTAVRWGADIVLPIGEIRPGVRTRKLWLASPIIRSSKFGRADWVVVGLYMTALVGVGYLCSRRTGTTADYFLASGRVPWWAVGVSIFATMLSAMTYLGHPARTFGSDWSRIFLNLGIFAVAPIVIYYYLPFFRKLKVTSAYEYLEARFNLGIRWLGSLSFVLFQIGRMGVVVFLPALALSVVTGLHVTYCILAIGLVSTIYTVVGGIEAVIWTDVLQTVVLILGAMTAIWIISSALDGGFFQILEDGYVLGKVSVAELHWDWTGDALAVVLIGAIFANLLPYTSDQTIIQRYMTAPSDAAARRAVWTNAFLAIPSSILFFLVGTALFVFYRHHPESLDPIAQADSIFPWFIAYEMPAGIAGLVIAGIFAASMSSLDSSMHSIATALTTDFVKRCRPQLSERHYLIWARSLTVLLGIVGTCSGLMLATMNVSYLWDYYINIIGLLLGTLAGLFALGIFTSHTNSLHAWIGAIASVVSLAYVQYGTDLNGLLYGAVALWACVAAGAIAGVVLPMQTKQLEGLTWHRR